MHLIYQYCCYCNLITNLTWSYKVNYYRYFRNVTVPIITDVYTLFSTNKLLPFLAFFFITVKLMIVIMIIITIMAKRPPLAAMTMIMVNVKIVSLGSEVVAKELEDGKSITTAVEAVISR